MLKEIMCWGEEESRRVSAWLSFKMTACSYGMVRLYAAFVHKRVWASPQRRQCKSRRGH